MGRNSLQNDHKNVSKYAKITEYYLEICDKILFYV